MGVLEIIAEQQLGTKRLKSRPQLRAALERIEKSVRRPILHTDEKARIAALVELFFAYERESDEEEKANILRTLEEIGTNEPLELPTATIEEWEASLEASDSGFEKAKIKLERRHLEFRKKYFSLRAKAGLTTQTAVANKSGLRRSYVAVIESGNHCPQQKTLQKLAKAFGVDVAKLLV